MWSPLQYKACLSFWKEKELVVYNHYGLPIKLAVAYLQQDEKRQRGLRSTSHCQRDTLFQNIIEMGRHLWQEDTLFKIKILSPAPHLDSFI